MRRSTSLYKYALLVIDMQEEFRQCAVKIVDQLNKTIQICRQNNVPSSGDRLLSTVPKNGNDARSEPLAY
ncbi:Nicotinamidase [Trichinella spiralis]|uniref:Nicotinamidase n=1 Tax=Trichinella spiralis TaxID=6334 RepID=A0ABR3KIA7_TRISP